MEKPFIKRLEPDDWRLWKDIRLEALKIDPESFGGAYEEETLKTDEYWRQNLEDHYLLGLFEAEQLVATAGFHQLTSKKLCHRGMIFSVFTKKQARQKGYSRHLLQEIITYAKSHVKQLHMHCSTKNKEVLTFYQSLGFTVYGTEPNALCVQNQYYDEHLLVRIF